MTCKDLILEQTSIPRGMFSFCLFICFFGSAEFQTTHRFIGCLVNSFNLFAFIVILSSLFHFFFLPSVLLLCPHFKAEEYLNS